MEEIKKGDIICIKDEFLDSPNEKNCEYKIIEDNGDRVLITPINTKLTIPPRQTIKKKMIKMR